MPDPVTGVVGGVSLIGGALQSRSNRRAVNAQVSADQAAIDEQRRQFDTYQRLLQPYVNAGTPALQGLLDIAGLGGGGATFQGYLQANPDVAAEAQRAVAAGEFRSPQEYAEWHYNNYGQAEGRQLPEGSDTGSRQQAAYSAIENSPGFQTLARQGEEAILQNASATGGLRGGNTQGAIARFRPALLDQFIERQFGRLGGIASIGQNAAAGVGSAGLSTGANVGNLLSAQGATRAQGAINQGNIFGNILGGVSGALIGGLGGGNRLSTDALQTIRNNPGIF